MRGPTSPMWKKAMPDILHKFLKLRCSKASAEAGLSPVKNLLDFAFAMMTSIMPRTFSRVSLVRAPVNFRR
jgi:hypothetical protein